MILLYLGAIASYVFKFLLYIASEHHTKVKYTVVNSKLFSNDAYENE